MSSSEFHSPSTISDIERTVQVGLEALRNAPLSDQIASALKFLVPPGYRPIAQLEEDGRKKRSTADASNWTPETGEIVIYFEPLQSQADVPKAPPPNRRELPQSKPRSLSPVPSSTPSLRSLSPAPSSPNSSGAEASPEEITSIQLQQCCDALAEAEKAGKLFIAFKWFRDEALLPYNFDWAASAETRQRVLAAAIESGAIQTKRIPNPKSTLHPTTTVSLNRAHSSRPVASRFHPIAVQGEPVSATILRDRGSL